MWNFIAKTPDVPIMPIWRVVEAVIKAALPLQHSRHNRLLPPEQFGEKIAYLKNNVQNIDKKPF